jgi:F420-non-reducing hydrogenase small subunit
MKDGELTVSFINGAIRTSEQLEMAHLLRRKSYIVIAFGSCSHLGGIPGLANLYEPPAIFKSVYYEAPSNHNPDRVTPRTEFRASEGALTLPLFHDTVKTLDQVVAVDYYLPGCPPPVNLIQEALGAILQGALPAKGAVLAPDKALCDECKRRDSKPDKLMIPQFKRPHEFVAEQDKCLLAQGLLCMGPATRAGCRAACVDGNMPCTGCLGPTSRILDQGGKALSAVASIVDAVEEPQIDAILNGLVDPAGAFYRYSLPASLLHRSVPGRGGVKA